MSGFRFEDKDINQTTVPEQCSECPIARMLSGEALEFLIQNCTGLTQKSMGCEDVPVCGSPEKYAVEAQR